MASIDSADAHCVCGRDEIDSNWIKRTKEKCESQWWHTICGGMGTCKTNKDVNFCNKCPWTCPAFVMAPFQKNLPLCTTAQANTNVKTTKAKNNVKTTKAKNNTLLENASTNISTLVEKEVTKHIPLITRICAEAYQKQYNLANTSCASATINTKNFNQNGFQKADVEHQERARRKNNIIVFNLPESTSQQIDVQLKNDCSKLKQILDEKVNVATDDFVNVFRLGSKAKSKTRPLLLKCKSENVK